MQQTKIKFPLKSDLHLIKDQCKLWEGIGALNFTKETNKQSNKEKKKKGNIEKCNIPKQNFQ